MRDEGGRLGVGVLAWALGPLGSLGPGSAHDDVRSGEGVSPDRFFDDVRGGEGVFPDIGFSMM